MKLGQDLYEAQEFLRNANPGFFQTDLYDLGLLLAATVFLVAVLVPRFVDQWHIITSPILFVAVGAGIFLLPIGWQLPDLVDDVWWPKRLTELAVIVSLTSAGLKLNKPFSWRTWQVSWRLLVFTMPLTIITTAALGWWAAGLVPASALLLGAVIAPTDPVLASDVQTGGPTTPDASPTRVGLTTEAGLNDGLAFPFTNLAIAVALVGLHPGDWFVGWLVIDVFYKILVGALVGATSGWLLSILVFRTSPTHHLARTMTGILSLSLTLFPYALAELASSYGFIAVFVAACVFRQSEALHRYQAMLHDFSEEMERILMALLMFLIGAYVAQGILASLTLPMVLIVILIVFVVRPVTGILALWGCRLAGRQKWAVAFFGIRGIGSIYYLAYAIYHVAFPQAHVLWAMVILVVLVSVVVHGLSAPPIMMALDYWREKVKMPNRD